MESSEIHDNAAKQAGIDAAIKYNPDKVICICNPVPTCFGTKWSHALQWVREHLARKYKDKLKDLIILSVREFIYACQSAETYIFLSSGENIFLEKNYETSLISTPLGYADYQGWASTLFDGLEEVDKKFSLLEGLSLTEYPIDEDILYAIALKWFFDAESCIADNPEKAFDLLFESSHAISFMYARTSWDEAVKEFENENNNENPAAVMARKRHIENYKLKEYAVKYWQENIDKNLSAQKAANELLKVVPLSHKKLAEYISEAKKKL